MILIRLTEKEAESLGDFLSLARKFKEIREKIIKAKKEYYSKYPIQKDKDGNWLKEKEK